MHNIFQSKQTDLPLVSIITNTYNSSFFIKECIESVLNQSYSNWELLIIDCGSSDNTLNLISKYTDTRIKVCARGFCGVAEGRNYGISKAKGEYIAILDSDDISSPERLMHQVLFLELNNDYVAVGSGMETFSSKKTRIKRYSYNIDNKVLYFLLSSGFNPIPHSSLMFRKSMIDLVGIYNTDIEKSEDYDLIFRLANFGKIKLDGKILLNYRVSNNSHTYRHKPDGKDIFYYVVFSQLIYASRKNNNIASDKMIASFLNHVKSTGARKLIFIWSICIVIKNFRFLTLQSLYLIFKHLFSLRIFSIDFLDYKWVRNNSNPFIVVNNLIYNKY